jgi:hypothetical protein
VLFNVRIKEHFDRYKCVVSIGLLGELGEDKWMVISHPFSILYRQYKKLKCFDRYLHYYHIIIEFVINRGFWKGI